MSEDSFKERVKNVVISEADAYNENYVNYDYLVCSDAFQIRDYYIIDAKPDNYMHLTGVSSSLSAQQFFTKCINGTLLVSDFNISKSLKGNVRRKIQVLPSMTRLFDGEIVVEESFVKNSVSCSFATSDNKCTIGFINNSRSVPKSLLKGNELDTSKAKLVSLLLRKNITKEKFDEIIIGSKEILAKYYEKIKDLIDFNLVLKDIKDQSLIVVNEDILSVDKKEIS